ncbi:MAG: DUF2634 domain-containing protein [Oscillospiraceae bacterium]
MIPFTTAILSIDENEEQPSQTYKMDVSDEAVRGYTDNLDAMKQAVFKILQTERYQSLIYSGGYGVELADLFGQPVSYVQPELERRIREALMQDERILTVGDFEFSSKKKGELLVAFKVKTVFGDFSAERSVNI